MISKKRLILVALTLSCGATFAQHERPNDELSNWFGDPFFQISDGISTCPEPRGPRMTQAEKRQEAHYRVERGTSCWLAKKCEHSNAYMYDQEIASSTRLALAKAVRSNSSVWVTIKRRWVFLEGCVRTATDAAALKRAATLVPDVESVVSTLSVAGEKPRYQTLR